MKVVAAPKAQAELRAVAESASTLKSPTSIVNES
jgi:hypothetical protein